MEVVFPAFIVQNVEHVFKTFSIRDFFTDLGRFCFCPYHSQIATLLHAPVNILHHVLIPTAV